MPSVSLEPKTTDMLRHAKGKSYTILSNMSVYTLRVPNTIALLDRRRNQNNFNIKTNLQLEIRWYHIWIEITAEDFWEILQNA